MNALDLALAYTEASLALIDAPPSELPAAFDVAESAYQAAVRRLVYEGAVALTESAQAGETLTPDEWTQVKTLVCVGEMRRLDEWRRWDFDNGRQELGDATRLAGLPSTRRTR